MKRYDPAAPGAAELGDEWYDMETLAIKLGIRQMTMSALVEQRGLPGPHFVNGQTQWSWAEVQRSTYVTEPEKWARPKMPDTYPDRVYFLRCNEFIKIGYTNDLKTRMAGIQIANPHELSLLHSIMGDRDTEAELHIRFYKYRVRGEWFSAHPDLVDYIEKLKGAG